MTEPVEHDLPAFIAGELPPEDMERVAAALDADPVLEAEYEQLLEAAIALDEFAPAPSAAAESDNVPEVTGSATGSPDGQRRSPWVLAAAAVAVLALGFGVGSLTLRNGGGPASTERQPAAAVDEGGVRLVSLDGGPAGAVAHIHGTGESQEMVLEVNALGPAPAGHHYEVWLLSEGAEPMPVGILAGDEGRFAAPTTVTANYETIDVSLEPSDSDPAHSGVSLLRGRYA